MNIEEWRVMWKRFKKKLFQVNLKKTYFWKFDPLRKWMRSFWLGCYANLAKYYKKTPFNLIGTSNSNLEGITRCCYTHWSLMMGFSWPKFMTQVSWPKFYHGSLMTEISWWFSCKSPRVPEFQSLRPEK